MRRPETNSKPAPTGAPAPATARPRIPVWLLAGLLVLATTAVYWPATRCDFINYDDDLYVTSNVHVQNGLNLENVKWAFGNTVAANWHPFTMLSHMLDCQIYGLKPWGHHLTNVLLHALNAALVFVLLYRLTKTTWRSVLVAALFAVHPLHVESVAWVAERKDVLSGFFGLLSLIFYTRYAQAKQTLNPVKGRSRAAQLYAALLFFALGLMCKPVLVTWPFAMLLLDYWPLGRITHCESRITSLRSLSPLLWEKIPFFAVAATASLMTFLVQQHGGAFGMVENLPLGARVGNALISYCRYLMKLFWPSDLAVFYPHPGYWPLATELLAALLLVVVTVLFFVMRRQYPFLLMGWLWFGGTLVPVIGLVQVGGQAMADRYTYLPLLGSLILAVWGAYELIRHSRYRSIAVSVAGSAVIVASVVLSRRQLEYWQNSETLFRHALAVTKNNFLAHSNLGEALLDKGEVDEAIRHFEVAIRLKPDDADAHYNLGTAYGMKGRTDEAIRQLEEVVRLRPDNVSAHNNLGIALFNRTQTDEAIKQFQEVVRLDPNHVSAHNNLGIALDMKGQTDEAISQYQAAIRLKPDYIDAHFSLGADFDKKGQTDQAISQYQEVIRLKPDYTEAHYNLGIDLAVKGRLDEAIQHYRQAIQADPSRPEFFYRLGLTLGQLGRTREAIAEYREALKLNPNLAPVLNNLAWALATSSDDELRSGSEAVRLAERACELTHYSQPWFVGTLAAAYAEAGRFPEAVATAEKAEQLATKAGQAAVATKNRQLLELYRAGKPYREPAPVGQG